MSSSSHLDQAPSGTRRLHRHLLIYSVIAVFTISSLIAAASFYPLYRHLRSEREQSLTRLVQTRARNIEQVLRHFQDVAWQITSRSAIRRSLERYNAGETTLQELVAFTTGKLGDALLLSDNVAAIARYDARGQQVVQVGLPVPRDFWLVPPASTTSAHLGTPFQRNGRPYLSIQVPIVDPTSQSPAGTDVVLFDARELERIRRDPGGLEGSGRISLGKRAEDEFHLFDMDRDSPIGDPLRAALVQAATHNRDELIQTPKGMLIVGAPVNIDDWMVLLSKHSDEVYQPLYWQMLPVGALILFLVASQAAGLLLLLRPLAGQALVGIQQLAIISQQLRATCEQSPVSIVITDPRGTIEYVNPRFEAVTGYRAEEVVGHSTRMLGYGRTPVEQYQDLWQTITAGRVWRGRLCNRKKNGELFWESESISPIFDEQGRITHFVGVREDITLRKHQEDDLSFQANYDTLTNLPNRLSALDRLRQAIAHAQRNHNRVALLFLDLDHFKHINDTLGHDAGDEVLKLLATRLGNCLRDSDTLARLGGDEFLLVLPDLTEAAQAESVARKLLLAATSPLLVQQQTVSVAASIGIALYPDDATTVNDLLRHADAAMYSAKDAGRDTFRFFTRTMNEAFQARLHLEKHLDRALERNEMLLHYQPLVDLKSGAVVGAEALLRWHSPELGVVDPGRFLPVAEQSGLILPLGHWVLQRACREAMAWHGMGLALRVSVNLSPRQLRDRDLANKVADALHGSGLAHQSLELEFTEQLLVQDAPGLAAMIEHLHHLGVRLAMDDFGTGISSLSHLWRFPLSTLKLDVSFVADLDDHPEVTGPLRAVLATARELGLETVAEGIESRAQLSFLREGHCEFGQGYLFSQPMNGENFRDFLQDCPLLPV